MKISGILFIICGLSAFDNTVKPTFSDDLDILIAIQSFFPANCLFSLFTFRKNSLSILLSFQKSQFSSNLLTPSNCLLFLYPVHHFCFHYSHCLHYLFSSSAFHQGFLFFPPDLFLHILEKGLSIAFSPFLLIFICYEPASEDFLNSFECYQISSNFYSTRQDEDGKAFDLKL